MKSILHSDRKNAILIDFSVNTQISIAISCGPMQIFCQQCCHVDWDCDSLIVAIPLRITISVSLTLTNPGRLEGHHP